MSRLDFLSILELSLNNMTYEEKKEILYDYEEHFRIGIENGKTEEEICSALGDPKMLAKLYKANYTLELAKEQPSSRNILRAVFAAISLGFLNLIFVFGPFVALCAFILALFVSALAVTVSGIIIFVSSFLPFLRLYVSFSSAVLNTAALIFIGIGITALGLLFIIGVCYIGKYFYECTLKYLKWNVSLIKDKKEC